MIVNKKELAQILGVAENTLTTWQKQIGFPIKSVGSGRTGSEYDTAEVIAWIKKREVDNLMANSASIDIEEAKRRKIAAEAGLAELELAKEQGSVVMIEDVSNKVGEQFANLRAKLLAIPSKASTLVFTAKDVTEAKLILETAILETLNELVGHGQAESSGSTSTGIDQDAEGPPEATTETLGQSMG